MSDAPVDDRPLELLFERQGLPKFPLPHALVQRYGGELGFRSPCLYANFVASLDGVVGLSAASDSGPIISAHSDADRFVMGMLRSCADAVIVAAGTFRKASGHRWNAETIYPAAAAQFAEARRSRGLRPEPQLVLISRSGAIDTREPAVRDAWIVTSSAGERALRARTPSAARVIVIDSDDTRLTELMALLHAEGLRVVLTEGGPSLFAQLVAAQLLDELFLTSAPALFGRYANDQRKSLADGLDLDGARLELSSVRRHGSHLFLRYACARSGS